MNPILIALAISVAMNAALGWAYLGQRDDTATVQAELRGMQDQRDGARQAASACSDSVDDLRELANKRAREAAPARAAAASAAQGHNQRADQILAAPAPVPGDVCASAQARVDHWLKGRVKP
jgi:septal ring factor EnvC (AmiA/AmiB activator)